MIVIANQWDTSLDDTTQAVGVIAPPRPAAPRSTTPTDRMAPRRPKRHYPRISLAARNLQACRPVVQPKGDGSLAYRGAKRAMDIVGAAILLLLLSPVMLTVLVILLVTTKGRPFYRQDRCGYLGVPFQMLKFRTMRLDADKLKAQVSNEQEGPIFKNRRDPRITRIGRFLRKTSLDETPQLLHVLSGRMSLVGPRPIALSEARQFEGWHRERMAVKPGLTCLWQVSGRSEIGFEDWIRLDIWYVRNQGMGTDLKLLLRTPLSVVSGRGAY